MGYTKDLKRVSVALDEELFNKLDTISKAMNRSKNQIINELLETYLESFAQMYEAFKNPVIISQLTELADKTHNVKLKKELKDIRQKFKNPKAVKNADAIIEKIKK